VLESKSGAFVISIKDDMANVKRFVLDRPCRQVVLMSESTNDYPPIVIHSEDLVDYLAKTKVVRKPKVA
jgi:hypothetical protein